MELLVDPYWPWKQPGTLAFWLAMGGFCLILMVTLLSYRGVPGATTRRVALLVVLRLLAFLLALMPILRPSFGMLRSKDEESNLWILADTSESMSVGDEVGGKTRWDLLEKHIQGALPLLERLSNEQGTKVRWFGFDDKVTEMSPDKFGRPVGRLTDIGGALHDLMDKKGVTPFRGLVLLSDGAENGPQRFPARAEAGRWLASGCPVQTFVYGDTNTNIGQRDVALSNIITEPSPLIPLGGEMTVKLRLDGPGFVDQSVRVVLMIDDKPVSPKIFVDGVEQSSNNPDLRSRVRISRREGIEVILKYRPMEKAGEVKVEARVEDPQRPNQALTGEQTGVNNTIGTYVNVAKEGISVLYLEKPRAWEPTAIIDALARDSQISVYPVWIRGGAAAPLDKADPLGLKDRAWDVIIIGDVLASQVLKEGGADALNRIQKIVEERGTGVVMLGGYNTFGDGDWAGTPIEKILPVFLDRKGQVERETKMVPTEPGLRLYGYVMNMGNANPLESWNLLKELEGFTLMGSPKLGANILAKSPGGDPMLVTQDYGKGRVMAFAGDTTHRWVRTPATKTLHDRFWQRMIRWLAHREDQTGTVYVSPDTRRIPLRSDLGFRVGIRGKSGADIENGTYQIEVLRPDGSKANLQAARFGNEMRGRFENTDKPGEYRLLIKGEGKDVDGTVVTGESSARFLVYEEDQEMARIAADTTFMENLGKSGGGTYVGDRGERLQEYLRSLLDKPPQLDRADFRLYPDWRNMEASATGSGFLAIFYLIFVAILGGEWLLRRTWGLA